MTYPQFDIRNSTSTRPERQPRMMPFRDRRDRVVCYVAMVAMVAMVTVNSIVIGSASWAGWPFWAWLAMCLPAFFIFVAGYGLWYRRRTPTAAGATSV